MKAEKVFADAMLSERRGKREERQAGTRLKARVEVHTVKASKKKGAQECIEVGGNRWGEEK